MGRQFLLLLIVALMLLPTLTRGQENLSITVTTDKQTYAFGQIIFISILVQQSGAPAASVVVFYKLVGPQNQLMTDGFGITDSTGKYVKIVTVGNDFPVGTYTAYASVSVNDQTASATSAFQTVPEFASGFLFVQAVAFLIAIALLSRKRKPGEQAARERS